MFWEDLARDMQDPEFARAYVTESVRIAAVDAVIAELDSARVTAGLSKAALARAVGAEPAVIRRMFSMAGANPTLGTVAGVAAALGLQVTLEPLSAPERELVTAALRSGRATAATARLATQMRAARPRQALPGKQDSGERPGTAGQILPAQLADLRVLRRRDGRAERLGEPGDDDQERLADAVGVVIQHAVEPVVMPSLPAAGLRPVGADLEPAGHVAVHSFPVPAAGEPVRRRRGHRH